MKSVRVDQLLLERGLVPSRERARALILAGAVIVDEHRVTKAGQSVSPTATIRLRGEFNPYVSRGGLKLQAGLEAFAVDPAGRICVDVGASTGGFTDCLLQRGARRVYAVDVGYGQLAWKLREDDRVVCLERQNIRGLERSLIPDSVDLVVVDASFISLRLVFPKLWELLGDNGGDLIALVKPQFEVGRDHVGKGGVVRDPDMRRQALDGVLDSARAVGFQVVGAIESPVRGAKKGNVESLVHLTRVGNPEKRN